MDKRFLMLIFPAIGFSIGKFLDRKETERMVRFRGKSALYGRPESTEPAW